MIQVHLKDAAKWLDIPAPAANPLLTGISHDTRTLTPGNLFVAIRGERVDGHDLLSIAAKQGARAALVAHPVDSPLPQLIVPDTIVALGALVARWRASFTLPLIAVTGSNGKTTVKNMIASIFTAATGNHPDTVLATHGNYNNAIGLPLTLAALSTTHQYAVLEMGMNHFGEIADLSHIAQPTVAIITNAAASHLAGVGHDIAGVAKAKGEIFSGLLPGGTAVLNADDPYFDYWQNLTGGFQRICFGLEKTADVSAVYTGRPEVELSTPAGVIHLSLPLSGRHNLMNALAATAACLAAGVSADAIQKGLAAVKSAPGRMEEYPLENGARLIDDSYNANPFSLQAAIAVLSTAPGDTILVLGDMKELGRDEIALHVKAGKQIADAGIHHLITYGTLSAHTAKAFGSKAKHFTSHAELLHALKPLITSNTTLLVKGSRSMEMNKIVSELRQQQPITSH